MWTNTIEGETNANKTQHCKTYKQKTQKKTRLTRATHAHNNQK